MKLQAKIKYKRIEELTGEVDQPKAKWWLKRVIDTARYIFTFQSRAFGLSSAAIAVAVALGVALATATIIVAPAVIVPLGLAGIGIGIYRQHKRHKKLKELSENIKISRKALKGAIKSLVDENKLTYGLENIFEPFEGENIEEKLKNIFGDDYRVLEFEDWIINYELMIKRKKMVNQFFERYGNKKINDEEMQAQIIALFNSLDQHEYKEYQEKIDKFIEAKNDWFPRRDISEEEVNSLQDLKTEIEPAIKKRWYNYLIEAAKDVLSAILSAGSVFGLIVGIAILVGVTVGTSGIGLVVLIVAIVLGVTLGIAIFAVKKYIHDQEKMNVGSLENANDISNKLVHSLNDKNIAKNEKTCEDYLGCAIDSDFLDNFEKYFESSDEMESEPESYEIVSSSYSKTPLGEALLQRKGSQQSSADSDAESQAEVSVEEEQTLVGSAP